MSVRTPRGRAYLSSLNIWWKAINDFLDFSEEEREFQEEFYQNDISFTQAELQYLKDYLAKELTMIEDWKNASKEGINYHWELSVPDTDAGKYNFHMLNINKKELRKEKIKQKKLVAIQQKIKALLKTL